MKPRLVISILGIAANFLLCAAASAQDTLRLGVTSGSPPYVYSIEEGRGLDMDILRAIVTKMGMEPEFVPVPFARRSMILASGKVDAVTFWTAPKDVICYAGQPYRFWRNALFRVHKKGADTADAPMKRIGIFRGSEHLAGALKAVGIAHASLQQISTINTAVRMMLYDRLDGYIGDYPTVVYNFKQEDPDGTYDTEILQFFPPAPQRLCFTDPAMANRFDTALSALVEDTPEALSEITRAHGLSERITPPMVE